MLSILHSFKNINRRKFYFELFLSTVLMCILFNVVHIIKNSTYLVEKTSSSIYDKGNKKLNNTHNFVFIDRETVIYYNANL